MRVRDRRPRVLGGDAAHTRASAITVASERIWPQWAMQQIDPQSPAYRPDENTNLTSRNWTAIGNIASAHRAIVDPHGLLTPQPHGWSLDWWIGAEDRWHFPSREHAVRQALVGTTPVVETLMRVPSGDAAARAYTIVGDRAVGDLAVLEVENRSAAPVAVAFAIRPYNAEGLALVSDIEVTDRVVAVNGRPAVLLPRVASAIALRAFADGGIGEWVTAGAPAEERRAVDCPAGLAEAALVFPLAHWAVLRVALPLAPDANVAGDRLPPALPAASDVARAWEAHARRGLGVTLPPGRMADAFEANRKFVLAAFAGTRVVTTPSQPDRLDHSEAAALIGALDRLGFHDEAAEVLMTFPDHQHLDGSFGSGAGATGAAIGALATHWRLARDAEVLAHTLPAVGLAARWIDRRGGAWPTRTSERPYAESFSGLRGLLDAGELLRDGGHRDAAKACAQASVRLREAIDASLASGAATLGTDAMPVGPARQLDAAAVWSLTAGWPSRVFAPSDRRLIATMDTIADQFCDREAVVVAGTVAPAATMLLAATELMAGRPRAVERINWLVEIASATFTWPDALDPASRKGAAGEGHSAWAAAWFVSLLRDLLVSEEDGGLAICNVLPQEWEGQGLEVHDAATSYGKLSFAVRWHGPRPALLWDLALGPGAGEIRLRAPGLDPEWSATSARGEALLRPLGAAPQ
jgi:hypothetical protein